MIKFKVGDVVSIKYDHRQASAKGLVGWGHNYAKDELVRIIGKYEWADHGWHCQTLTKGSDYWSQNIHEDCLHLPSKFGNVLG